MIVPAKEAFTYSPLGNLTDMDLILLMDWKFLRE
jgi:hypothetical protein